MSTPTSSTPALTDEVYQQLPDELIAAEYIRSGSKLDQVRVHLSSLLPSYIDASNIFESKLRNRGLNLINERSKELSTKQSNRCKRDREAAQQKTMSSREKKQRGLFQLPKYGVVYNHYLPLHQLWQRYILEILGNSLKPLVVEEKLLKADYHGCFLTVHESKNPCLIGTEGLVLQETQETFKIITVKNVVKTVAKRGSVFRVDLSFIKPRADKKDESSNTELPVEDRLIPFESSKACTIADANSIYGRVSDVHVLIYGSQFGYRAAERMARKFKVNTSIELK